MLQEESFTALKATQIALKAVFSALMGREFSPGPKIKQLEFGILEKEKNFSGYLRKIQEIFAWTGKLLFASKIK